MSEARSGGLLSRLKVDKYLLLIISMVVAASFLPARGEAAFAFGGVAAKALMAEQVAQAVLGKPWTQKTLEVGRGGGGEGRLGQEGGLYPTKQPPCAHCTLCKPCVYAFFC